MQHQYLDFSGHDPTEHDEELATWEGVPGPAPPLKKARVEGVPEEEERPAPAQERAGPSVRRSITKKGNHPGGSLDRVKSAKAAEAEVHEGPAEANRHPAPGGTASPELGSGSGPGHFQEEFALATSLELLGLWWAWRRRRRRKDLLPGHQLAPGRCLLFLGDTRREDA